MDIPENFDPEDFPEDEPNENLRERLGMVRITRNGVSSEYWNCFKDFSKVCVVYTIECT